MPTSSLFDGFWLLRMPSGSHDVAHLTRERRSPGSEDSDEKEAELTPLEAAVPSLDGVERG
jgi:hypothetical protein